MNAARRPTESSLSTQSIASIGSKFKPFFLRFPYLDQWEEPPEEAYEWIGIKLGLASDQPIWCYPALDNGRRVPEKRLLSFCLPCLCTIDPVERASTANQSDGSRVDLRDNRGVNPRPWRAQQAEKGPTPLSISFSNQLPSLV
jgi:hypothetical protein